jgi:anti-sigma regulatory factor (Ser/Thr protein kinase)
MLVDIAEATQAGDARRKAVAIATSLQMDETRCGQIALATTEIATNLVKHAGRGYILLQQLLRDGISGIRITGVDKGPGISDVARALEDGHSTASSMGAGLGAIRRLSDSFNLYTNPGIGTVIDVEFWHGKPKVSIVGSAANIEVACVSEPIRGEDANGDGWGTRQTMDSILLMVVDGLGHGILASEAAREAERILAATSLTSTEQLLQETHLALKKTRGAAEAIARIDVEKGLLAYAGVGNISASVVAPGSSRSLASYNGTLGQQMERLQQFTCPWNKDSILVMHSDGLATRWDLRNYPGIWPKPPSVIAAVLHRDFRRERDDVTVLVAKAA